MDLQEFCDKAVSAYWNIELDDLRKEVKMDLHVYHQNDGYTDTWILSGFPYAKRKVLTNVFSKWQWAPGFKCRGAFFTHDQQTAIQTALRVGVEIEEVS